MFAFALLLLAVRAPTPTHMSLADPCVRPPITAGSEVPGEAIAGRFFVRWSLRDGTFLRFFLDTGGPRDQVNGATVRRLGLARQVLKLGNDSVSWVRIPAGVAGQLAPALRSNDWQDTARRIDDGSVRVMAGFTGSQLDQLLSGGGGRIDGILGPDWFGGRVWTLDYPAGRLFFHGTDEVASLPLSCWLPLGFQVDSSGARTSNFPRITATIDGEAMDFLFDAGATTSLTDSAVAIIGGGEMLTRGASFIVRERFEQWHAHHPDWPVVVNADARFHNRMIRVPEVEIGGKRLGPVWFSERPNAAFHDFMSQWMDQRIDGALGGSAFRDAVVILDYPRARAALFLPATRES